MKERKLELVDNILIGLFAAATTAVGYVTLAIVMTY